LSDREDLTEQYSQIVIALPSFRHIKIYKLKRKRYCQFQRMKQKTLSD